MLIPVFTFYVNDADPQGEKKLAIVGRSPIRDLNVTAIVTDPEASASLLMSLSEAVLQAVFALEAEGKVTDQPVPGFEPLFGLTKEDAA